MTSASEAAPPTRIVTGRFAVLFAGTFALFTAIGIAQPVLPRLVRNGLGGSDGDVGTLLTVYAVAAIGCRPLLSWVGRRGPKALLVTGAVVSVAGFALHVGVRSLPVLALARVVVAVGEALVWVGYGTFVTGLAPPGRVAEAISLSSVAVFAGLAAGPLVGDPLARAGRFDLAFAIATVVTLGCLGAALATRSAWYPATPVRRGRLRAREVFHPRALPTGLVLAFAMFGWSGWNAYVALHGDAVGMGSVAPVFGLYAALTLAFRLLGAKVPELVGLRRCAAGALVGIAAGLVVLAVWPSPAGVYAGTFVLGCGTALMYPSLSALTLERAPDPAERAVVLGSFGMFFEVGAGLGGLALGRIADAAGLRPAFGVAAAVTAAGLGLLAALGPRGQGRPRLEASPAG